MTDRMQDTLGNTAGKLADDLRDGVDAAKHSMRDRANDMRDVIERASDTVQDGVSDTRRRVKAVGGRLSSAARDTGDYFKEHGVRGAMGDVEGLVREHPGKAMLATAAIGFLIGRALSRRD
jgi:ElaB/YqjD/DUF883 family membrane-anchored ribosome-binding protein